jgi:hypothetical protein
VSKHKKSSSKQAVPDSGAAKPASPAKKKQSSGLNYAIGVFLIYLMTLVIFPRNVFENYDFAFGGDNLAAAPIAKMGQDFEKAGGVPGWCPYILGGMPTVGSLLYANHYYPGFSLGEILSFLYFGSKYSWLFLHYLFAGLGIFLVLRQFGVHWILSAICGILYAYNPTLVVYADVGHGSKLMAIAYLPWMLLLVWRLFARPGFGRAALLGIGYGLMLLSLHVQIAYYGAMLMGLCALFQLIAGGKMHFARNIKASLLMIAAGILAFFISSPLYLQVLEYSHYSIRGGGATGGASWDYATAWSFHPLESLTYIFPNFFGFGGQTYWGFMPFTDMPLYWGGVVLLFAPWALFLSRQSRSAERYRMTIFLLLTAVLAWIISFGKFLPVLYYPLFELLPYFNKFRVPSLIQSLVLLPAVILAGIAMQEILESIQDKNRAERLSRLFTVVGISLAGFCLLLIVFQSALKPMFYSWFNAARPQYRGEGAGEAFALWIGDAFRLILLTGFLYGGVVLVLKQKWHRVALFAAVILCAVLELYYFDRNLIHPTHPQQMEAYLQPDDVVQFLQRESEPFRIFPLNQERNQDWYMPFHIESVLGYTAARLRLFKETTDSLSYNNFNLLRLLNTRFFISDKPIVHEDFREVFTGRRERVIEYLKALPRAFLVNRAVLIGSAQEAFRLFRSGETDFSRLVALESAPSQPLDAGAAGEVRWIRREPDHLVLDVTSSGHQILVLSDVYYPAGWTATLDGEATPILKANYLFRGVEIPAGNHRVEMTFRVGSLATGNRLKWIAYFLIALSLIFDAVLPAVRRISSSRARDSVGV